MEDKFFESGYVLGPKIGSGAMGTVYRAESRFTGEEFAIKILKPEHSSDRKRLTRFLNEREALARINHSNVVAIDDLVMEGNLFGIVMEFVDGGDLRDLLYETPMTEYQIVIFAEGMAAGLEAIHSAHIVHRDLKPENILVVERYGAFLPKVADFGIARLLDNSLTGTTGVSGTLRYMSPEVSDDRFGAVGPPADMYSLGVILFELLTGEPPYTHTGPMQLLLAHAYEDIPHISGIDPELNHLVRALLSKDMDDRPTIAELRNRLAEVRAYLESQAKTDPLTLVNESIAPATELSAVEQDVLESSGDPDSDSLELEKVGVTQQGMVLVVGTKSDKPDPPRPNITTELQELPLPPAPVECESISELAAISREFATSAPEASGAANGARTNPITDTIELSRIPVDSQPNALARPDLESTNLESTDLESTDLESTDLESTALESTALESTALESTDLGDPQQSIDLTVSSPAEPGESDIDLLVDRATAKSSVVEEVLVPAVVEPVSVGVRRGSESGPSWQTPDFKTDALSDGSSSIPVGLEPPEAAPNKSNGVAPLAEENVLPVDLEPLIGSSDSDRSEDLASEINGVGPTESEDDVAAQLSEPVALAVEPLPVEQPADAAPGGVDWRTVLALAAVVAILMLIGFIMFMVGSSRGADIETVDSTRPNGAIQVDENAFQGGGQSEKSEGRVVGATTLNSLEPRAPVSSQPFSASPNPAVDTDSELQSEPEVEQPESGSEVGDPPADVETERPDSTVGEQPVVPTSGAQAPTTRSSPTSSSRQTASTSLAVVPAAPGVVVSLEGIPGDASIDWKWSPPADDGGSPISYYILTPVSGKEITVQSPPYKMSSLTNGTAYGFQIRACNIKRCGPKSERLLVSPVTVPARPTSLTATVLKSGIELQWNAPAFDGGDSIEKYEIADDRNTTKSTNNGSYLWPLPEQWPIKFKVRACNWSGCGGWTSYESVSAVIGAAPAVPKGFTADRFDSAADLNWEAVPHSGSGSVSYRIEGPGAEIRKTSQVAYRWSGLANGYDYPFRVRACVGGSCGDWTPYAQVTPAGLPGRPTGLSLVDRTDSSLTLIWQAPDANGSRIVKYQVDWANGTPQYVEQTLVEISDELESDRAYSFRVRACNPLCGLATEWLLVPAYEPGN